MHAKIFILIQHNSKQSRSHENMSILLTKEQRKKLIDELNKGAAREITAIIQYSYHHVMAEGMESPALSEMFEKVALQEMEHLEEFADRIKYLGGVPTTKPNPIKVGGTLKQMVQDDLELEYQAIRLYKGQIAMAKEIGDTTTRLMLEKILTAEEEHADKWETVLKKRVK
jgi:bacterioferritin